MQLSVFVDVTAGCAFRTFLAVVQKRFDLRFLKVPGFMSIVTTSENTISAHEIPTFHALHSEGNLELK